MSTEKLTVTRDNLKIEYDFATDDHRQTYSINHKIKPNLDKNNEFITVVYVIKMALKVTSHMSNRGETVET